ncbi:hypothetical protein U1Q18_009307 [Sarracenia purpurea var. burkii]
MKGTTQDEIWKTNQAKNGKWMHQTEATQSGKNSIPGTRKIPTEDATAKAAEHKTEQYQRAEVAIQNAIKK